MYALYICLVTIAYNSTVPILPARIRPFFINLNQHPQFYHANNCFQTCVNSTSLEEV